MLVRDVGNIEQALSPRDLEAGNLLGWSHDLGKDALLSAYCHWVLLCFCLLLVE